MLSQNITKLIKTVCALNKREYLIKLWQKSKALSIFLTFFLKKNLIQTIAH